MNPLKKVVLPILILVCSSSLFSQNTDDEKRRETMESIKEEYIIERMELSTEDAKKVKEIRKEYQLKMQAQRAKHDKEAAKYRSQMKEKRESEEELTEEEAKMALTHRLQREEEKNRLEREYTEQMIAAISAKKTLEYKKLEREFKKELLEMLKDDEKNHHMREEFQRKRAQKDRMRHQK